MYLSREHRDLPLLDPIRELNGSHLQATTFAPCQTGASTLKNVNLFNAQINTNEWFFIWDWMKLYFSLNRRKKLAALGFSTR